MFDYIIIIWNYSILSGLLGTVLLLMIVSTVYDVLCIAYDRKHFKVNLSDGDDEMVISYFQTSLPGSKYQPFLVFSIYTNGRQLFPYNNPKVRNAIHCIDGIRALSILNVIFVHSNWKYTGLPLREKEDFSKV